MFKIKTYTIVLIGIFISTLVVSTEAFSQSKNVNVENTIEYFNQRNEAVGLVENEKWQEAIPILEKLTQAYQKDGDIFYLLGLSYYQVQQYPNAINALKKILDLGGGTVLTGNPVGSDPSNDIMIQIAKAYSLNGDKANALLWLQKGFEARYDEKPFIIGDPAFESFNDDKDFKALFGIDTDENISREIAWEKDLRYLEKRIKELQHPNKKALIKTDFSKSIQDIISNTSTLSDEQIVVEVMKVVGSLGSGHNLVLPTTPKIGALKKLPVQFYQFSDGLFIVDAEEGYEQWIGYEVISIENTPVEEALVKTNVVNARDNDMQVLWLGPYYLGLPDVLQSLAIINDTKEIAITLSDTKGNAQQVIMNPVSWNFTGLAKMPRLKVEKQPLFLSKRDDLYWYEFLPEHNAIFIQFNLVGQKEEQSLKDFNIELRGQIAQNKVQNFILDLRHNNGGNGAILGPMIKTIINFEAEYPEGTIFVLAGRETFSAAQNLLTRITTTTNAVFVGEPSGSSPNFTGESGWFKLPYSGLMGIISSQYHQSSESEDDRKWIAPHIPVARSSTDYFAGNDKAMDVILEVIKSSRK